MIKIAAAAAVAASIVFAPAAYADDDAYLDELSGQGFQVMWQSRPFLLAAGNGMCNDLRNGENPGASRLALQLSERDTSQSVGYGAIGETEPMPLGSRSSNSSMRL